MSVLSVSEWDRFLQSYPDAHLLQTGAWGDLKAAFGWQADRVRVGETGAQVLFRPLIARFPMGPTLAYVAKGPVGPDWPSLWPEIDALCRRRRAVILKVEPDSWEPETPQEAGALEACFSGFVSGAEPIQPRQTVVVRLEGDEDDWLSRMKQKTRYNIRLAEKKGVQVRNSSNLEAFEQMMQVTGKRDGFGVHSLEYYRRAYQLFYPQGLCDLLMAEYEGRPLAGLMVFARGARAWYLYGASNDEERNRMPTYLLQFEAMRWAKRHGCIEYDLWGIPDAPEAELESGFTDRSDGLWGVYRFKRGFGGEIRRSAGAFDRAYLPLAYPLYRRWSARRHESG